jgi:hypothetical protein
MESTVYWVPRGQVWFGAFQCDECGVLSIGYAPRHDGYQSALPGRISTVLDEKSIQWLPAVGDFASFEHVPEDIAQAASEAHACHSICAYRGAAILARAVVEATAKNKKAEGRDLYNRIERLNELGLLRGVMTTMAHDIRMLGNDMAHGDFAESPSEEDSEEILAFMDALLAEVYQHDGMVAARKARRSSDD